MIKVFVCKECGYEDSSFIPEGAKDISCKKECPKGYVECPICHKIVKKTIIEKEMGKGMTFSEFVELVSYINENHSFKDLKGKHIKYITPTYDTRTNVIHCIKLNDTIFSITNENKHRNLKEWIYNYLNN